MSDERLTLAEWAACDSKVLRLLDEVERLEKQSQIDGGRIALLLDEHTRADRLRAALDLAVQALRAVEWVHIREDLYRCPYCLSDNNATGTLNHKDTCSRQLALDIAEALTPTP